MTTCIKTTVLVGISALALSLFFSCSSQKEGNDVNSPLSKEIRNNFDSVDSIDSLIEELERDLLLDESACLTDNPQGLCCLSLWTLDSDESSRTLSKDIYNAYSFSHSIWADYEIWARAQMVTTEQLVPTDSILSAIENISAKKLDVRYQPEAEDFQNEMIWLIKNPDKWSEDRYPGRAYSKYDGFISNDVAVSFDTLKVFKYFSDVDNLIARYDSIQKEIETIEDESVMFESIRHKIEESKSFDEQCAITLACSSRNSTFCGARSIELMSALLQSGKYSVLLERMWILWRAFSQSLLIGRSRDAIIPNYSFDRMRKKVYLTISKHFKNNPEDTNAEICGLFLIQHTGLIRNGAYMFGNDADVDISNYCLNFWGSTEDE